MNNFPKIAHSSLDRIQKIQGGIRMTDVVCSATQCRHNGDGRCQLETLSVTSSLLNSEAECAFYESEK